MSPACLNATTWRIHPQFPLGHLYIHRPATVFAARVNQAAFGYPLLYVVYDTVTTGAYTDIIPGMTILFGSAPGLDDHGRQRVRSATSSVLRIGWSSRGIRDGEVNLSDNDYITVLEDHRVHAKIPRYLPDGTMYKDGEIAIGSYGTQQPPIANDGPAIFGKCPPGTTVYRTTWNAGGSKPMADSATISTYNRPCKDGTFIVGSASTSVATIDFPAGFRYIDLTVTDSNGQTHTCHTPVYVEPATSDGNSVVAVQISQPRHLTREGQTVSFKILENLSTSLAPEGSLVIYAEDEYYGGTVGSVNAGFSGRENVKFVGWIDQEHWQVVATPQGLMREVSLDCVDVAGRLRQLPGFPQAVERNASPANWNEMANANGNRYIHYLLYWHSTALEVADFDPGADDYPFILHGSDGQSLWEQVDFRTQAQCQVLTCDSQGRLALKRDQQLKSAADRTSTVIIALTEPDYLNLRGTRQRTPRYHWLRGSAIKTDTQDADVNVYLQTYFCISPGFAPGQGVSATAHGEQLVASQAELNTREGNRYSAKLNAADSTFEFDVTHPGECGIEPAWMEWITLTLGSTYAAQRGYTLSTARMLPIEVTYSYQYTPQGVIKTAHVVAEKEVTEQISAVTDRAGTVNLSPYEPPDTGQALPVISGWGKRSNDVPTKLFVMDKYGHVSYYDGSNWSNKSPTNVQLGAITEAMKLIRDPFNYKRHLILAKAGTSFKIYMTADITVATPTWTDSGLSDLLNLRPYTGADFRGNPNRTGHFYWTATDSGLSQVYVYTTLDNFSTHDRIPIQLGGGGPGFDMVLGSFSHPTFVVPYFNPAASAGTCYLMGQPIQVSSTDEWRTTGALASSSMGTAVDSQGGACMPFSLPGGTDNRDNNFISAFNGLYSGNLLMASRIDGTGILNQIPSDQSMQSPEAMIANEVDGSFASGIASKLTAAPTLVLTDDGGYSWYTKVVPGTTINLGQYLENGMLAGYPTNPNYLLLTGSYWLQYSADRGDSWTDLFASYNAWAVGVYTSAPTYTNDLRSGIISWTDYYAYTVNPVL